MEIRYVQAAISTEDFNKVAQLALANNMTKSDLVEIAIKEYLKRKEEGNAEEVNTASRSKGTN